MSAIRSNLYITHYSRSPAEMAQQRNTHLKHWSWDKYRRQNNEIHLSHRNCMALNTVWKFYQVNLGYNRLTASLWNSSTHLQQLPRSHFATVHEHQSRRAMTAFIVIACGVRWWNSDSMMMPGATACSGPDLSVWRPWAGSLLEAPTQPQML